VVRKYERKRGMEGEEDEVVNSGVRENRVGEKRDN
jgi:hypothetical protein